MARSNSTAGKALPPNVEPLPRRTMTSTGSPSEPAGKRGDPPPNLPSQVLRCAFRRSTAARREAVYSLSGARTRQRGDGPARVLAPWPRATPLRGRRVPRRAALRTIRRAAMATRVCHKFWHNRRNTRAKQTPNEDLSLSEGEISDLWARRDSNVRPLAPEAPESAEVSAKSLHNVAQQWCWPRTPLGTAGLRYSPPHHFSAPFIHHADAVSEGRMEGISGHLRCACTRISMPILPIRLFIAR